MELLEARIAPARIFALDTANHLASFDSATPNMLSAPITITGLGAGEVVKCIDFRAGEPTLFGVAIGDLGGGNFSGTVYQINTTTGVATALGAPFATTLTTNSAYDCDFDPANGALRITNGLGQNFRVDPGTGQIISQDSNITGPGTVAGIAYSNSFAGSGGGTLYAIDFANDDLYRIGGPDGNPSPNAGVGTKIADINASAFISADRIGFDIDTRLEGDFAYYTGTFSLEQRIGRLDLATGQFTNLGAIGNGATNMLDIAVQPSVFTFPDGKSFTYTDADGDLVTVKTSAGTLRSSMFLWLASADDTRRELRSMGIANDITFTGANLTFTAKKMAAGGDGRVDVGSIFANGVDLGAVTIGGNLESLTAGTGGTGFAVKSLSALSLGSADTAAASTFSNINGKVGALTVKGDVTHARFIAGSVDVTKIGGSILGGAGESSGRFTLAATKSFTVGGDLVGGAGKNSARVELGGTPAMVKVGGSIIGGPGEDSGFLTANPTGSFTLGGDLVGGGTVGNLGRSGQVQLGGNAATVKIGGSITGGISANTGVLTAVSAGSFTIGGSIVGGSGLSSGSVNFSGDAGTIKVAGSLVGEGSATGTLAGMNAKAITIGGSIFGGNGGILSGVVNFEDVGTLKLGGSIVGGGGNFSGSLYLADAGKVDIRGSIVGSGNGGSFSATSVQTFTLGGSIIAGDVLDIDSGTARFITAGNITIKGGLHGSAGIPAQLTVAGNANPANATEALAIRSIKIGGSVIFGEILIGGDKRTLIANASVQVQSISIGGDFIASSIVNGFDVGADGFYGTADDAPHALDTVANIKATIASIVIKGRATGTTSAGDSYAILSEKIGSVMIAGRKVTLDPLGNDDLLVGAFADLRLRERPIS